MSFHLVSESLFNFIGGCRFRIPNLYIMLLLTVSSAIESIELSKPESFVVPPFLVLRGSCRTLGAVVASGGGGVTDGLN